MTKFFQFDPTIFPWWMYARGVITAAGQLDWWHGMVAGGVAGVGLGALVRARRSLRQVPSTHGSARWSTRREIRQAGLMVPNGIPLGRIRGHTLYASPKTHTLVVSPTQGGKTSLLATALVTHRGHAIVGSPKDGGELYRMTASWRASIGQEVYRLAPLTSLTHRINLPRDCVRLDTLDEWGDMYKIAERMLAPSTHVEMRESEASRYFRRRGTNLLAAIGLFILKIGRRKSFAGMLDAMSHKEKLLAHMAKHTHPEISAIGRSVAEMADREQSAVWGTALSVLEAYRNPRLAWATDETDCDWRGIAQSQTPRSLYLVTDRVTDLQQVYPFFRAVLGQVVDDFTSRGQGAGLVPGQLLMDEFPHWGRMDVFETGITQLAGFDLSCTLAVQDLGQLWTTYGRDTAIWGNTVCKVFHAPAPGDETATKLSEMLGEATIGEVSTTRGGLGRATVTERQTGRGLMNADEVSTMAPRRALIFVKGLRPIYGWQSTYHRRQVWRGRVVA